MLEKKLTCGGTLLQHLLNVRERISLKDCEESLGSFSVMMRNKKECANKVSLHEYSSILHRYYNSSVFVIQLEVVGESQAELITIFMTSQCKFSEQNFNGLHFLGYVGHSNAELLCVKSAKRIG